MSITKDIVQVSTIKDIVEIIWKSLQIIVIFVGGIWAYQKFIKTAFFRPKLEICVNLVECKKLDSNRYFVKFESIVENKSLWRSLKHEYSVLKIWKISNWLTYNNNEIQSVSFMHKQEVCCDESVFLRPYLLEEEEIKGFDSGEYTMWLEYGCKLRGESSFILNGEEIYTVACGFYTDADVIVTISPSSREVSQFCTLAFSRGAETLGLSLCWLVFFPDNSEKKKEKVHYGIRIKRDFWIGNSSVI